VGAGTFAQRIDLNSSPGGTAAGYVTIQGAKPVGPTVTDTTGATTLYTPTLGNAFTVYGRHVTYLKIRNLEIRGGGGGIGIFGNSSFIEMSDNYLHDNRADVGALSAIRPTAKYVLTTNQTYGPEFGTMSHIVIARNRIEHWTTGFNTTLPTAGTETMTVAGKVVGFLIEDNLIIDGQFIGIDMIGKSQQWWIDNNHPTLPIPADSWPQRGIIRRNTVRSMQFGFGAADVGIYCDGCQDIVVEGNRVEDSPGYCFAMSTEEDQFLIAQIILRYNTSVNCGTAIFEIGPGVNTGNPTIHGLSQFLRMAHNTGVKTKANGPVLRWGWAAQSVVKNNMAVVSATVNVPYVWAPTDPVANPLINATLYWGSIEPDSWQNKGTTYLTFPSYQSGSGQDAQGLLADPGFTNLATRDLTLQPTSPALDGGVMLTTTTAAGSGQVVTVFDAHWWTDGYGMIPGDPIQIGAVTALVTAVNYTTGQITIDRPLSWVGGAGVSYPYLGTAPAMGACDGTGATCGMQGIAPVVGPVSELVMDLRFDENTGTLAHDSTANLHNGTLGAGAGWGPAKRGVSGVQLPGTPTGIVTVPGLLGTPLALTLAAWIRPSGFPGANAEVLTLGSYHALRIAPDRVVGFYYYASNSWSGLTFLLPLPMNVWTHLAYTVTPGSQQLYVNGLPVASGTQSSAIRWTDRTGNNTILGAHGDGLTTYPYQGAIDEARVYSVALSAGDVLALYREQVGRVSHRQAGMR
jgi:hypothetical protein